MKRLRSVETLGSTSALNSDKTGTLTLNQMTAVQMAIVGRRYAISGDGYSTTGQITHTGGQPDVPLEQYLLPMALCADAEVRDGALVGDPTEGALVVLAAKGGVDPTLTREQYPRVATLPVRRGLQDDGHVPQDEGRGRQGRHPGLHQGSPGSAPGPGSRAPTVRTAPKSRSRSCATPTSPRTSASVRMGLRVMATGQKDFDPATFDPNADLLAALQGSRSSRSSGSSTRHGRRPRPPSPPPRPPGSRSG